MAHRRRLVLAALASSVLSPAVVGIAPAHGGVVAVRYASPDGTDSATCLQADPCSIVKAINLAPSGGEVILAPGNYGLPHPLTTELYNPNPITVRASNPNDRPYIYSKSPSSAILLYGSTLSNLVLVSKASTAGLQMEGGNADHLAVFARAGVYGACSVYNATLTDTLCAESAPNDPAIGVGESGSGSDTNTFIGVTAVATGTQSSGLSISESGVTYSLSVTDSIIRGKQFDLRVSGSGAPATVSLDHSDFRPKSSEHSGTGAIHRNPTDTAGTPKFVDPAKGDFQEKPTSPTVDTGLTEPSSDVDLAGNPRLLGPAQDMGAFELLEPPAIHHLKPVRHHKHTASFTARVNSEGLPSHIRLEAKSGRVRITSGEVPVDSGGVTRVHLTLHHLKRHTSYTVRAVARNRGGRAVSPKVPLNT